MTKQASKETKKIHLAKDQVEKRIQELSEKIKEKLVGSENAKKRLNVYQKISKLKKALEKPDELLVNPKEKLLKMKKDRKRRIKKKIEKKKKIIEEK
jgi:hypothetical protein